MLSPLLLISICSLYMVLLVVLAFWAEKKAATGKDVCDNPVVYALSLTVYLTGWTFYGSVGKAASAGLLFLTIYLGPTLAVVLWWVILRKMVRVKNTYKITSIADFISLRYNKSTAIAAMVTVICMFAVVPYFSLQLQAIISTFGLITGTGGGAWADTQVGAIICAFVILFTILVGVRKVVPTERHQGMVVAMTAESIVKLVPFLAVGIYVTYYLFGGFGDLFDRFAPTAMARSLAATQTSPTFYISWFTYLLLSMSAVMFLPRQFHMAVVENVRERHILTALWLFPLYMLVMNIFVLPITVGGLLSGYPLQQADNFVLMLPLSHGNLVLSLLVFLGGFSAATGMIMVGSMTVSTMVSNHLLLPVFESVRPLGALKQYLLQCRWVSVALLVLAGYWFLGVVGRYFLLVDIGVLSFAAVLQFAPAIIGGLFWKKGNSAGALMGMGAGFALWIYTLILPALVQGGLLSRSILDRGPWGLAMLRPEQLLGVTGLDPVSHSVLWTMLLNAGLYVLGSLYFRQEQEERNISEQYVSALEAEPIPGPLSREVTVDLAVKTKEIEELYGEYFPAEKSSTMIRECLRALKIEDKPKISLAELAELYKEGEIVLASSIGAAAAHKAFLKSRIISPAEESTLKRVYAEILAELKLAPSDLKRRIDYHREREKLLTLQAAELEEKIRELDQEIRQRTIAEEALRDSERRLAGIIEFLPDPTFVVDAHGTIIIWNRAAEEFTGVRAEEMLGKGNRQYAIPFYGTRRPLLIDMVLAPDEAEQMKPLYLRLVMEEGKVVGESRTRSVRRGTAYTMGMAAPLYDSEGRVIAVIESVRDITEIKEAEEELKRHRANLEELVRERTRELVVAKERAEVASQAKSAFLSSMSHELRTPLNAILGYVQIFKRHGNLSEAQRQQLEIVRGSGEHLLSLINDILDMGKIEAQKMELEEIPFDLCALLGQVFNIAKIKAEEKDLGFVYEESTPLPPCVRGDQRKLKQVLLNLVSNAVKYTVRGQVVIRASYREDGELFRCEVADTGIGIPEDQLQNIFDPFTQLVGAGQFREGTGLGLSITKRLVTLMHGQMTLHSEPGRGSTFSVELPLPAASVDQVCTEATSTVTGYRGVRRRILVVDDNPTNASMLVELLEPLGFEIDTAGNGADALLNALQHRPDLVLLDLVMPGTDGLEVAQQMRRQHKLEGTKIIGTSATVTESPRKEAFAAICDDFIAKPVRQELLFDKIALHLGLTWEGAPSEVETTRAGTTAAELGEPFEVPPLEDLEELHGLALMGDMHGVRNWAAQLEQRDERYRRFAGTLRELAGRFQAKAVLALVQQHMRDRL